MRTRAAVALQQQGIPFEVLEFDASALRYERISVSAGVRGLQIWIDPRDLIQTTGATVESLTAGQQ